MSPFVSFLKDRLDDYNDDFRDAPSPFQVYLCCTLYLHCLYSLVERALSKARLLKCSRFFFSDLVCRPRIPSEDRGNWG